MNLESRSLWTQSQGLSSVTAEELSASCGPGLFSAHRREDLPHFILTKACVPHTVVIPGLQPGNVRHTTGTADLEFKAREPGSQVCALNCCTVLPSPCFTDEETRSNRSKPLAPSRTAGEWLRWDLPLDLSRMNMTAASGSGGVSWGHSGLCRRLSWVLKSCTGRGGRGGGPSSWFQWVGSPGYESRAG